MNTGKMRHRITFQVEAGNRGRSGDTKFQWADHCTVHAEYITTGSRALFAAQQLHSEVTGMFRLRYRPDLDAAMRIMFNGKVYSISAVVDVDERHRELNVMVSTGVSQS